LKAPQALSHLRKKSSLAERFQALEKDSIDITMNKFERSSGEAIIQYLDADLRVVKPGTFVLCAVTGQRIPLDELKYWSVERQEAYASPEAVLARVSGKSVPSR
jgi:hypothetical protein